MKLIRFATLVGPWLSRAALKLTHTRQGYQAGAIPTFSLRSLPVPALGLIAESRANQMLA